MDRQVKSPKKPKSSWSPTSEPRELDVLTIIFGRAGLSVPDYLINAVLKNTTSAPSNPLVGQRFPARKTLRTS